MAGVKDFWFVWWDACGLACFVFGELTMLFCNYSSVFQVIIPWLGLSSPWAWVNLLLFESILVLVHWSHWMAAAVVPGHVQPGKHPRRLMLAEEPDEGLPLPPRPYCKKCDTLRPQRAYHCSTCGVCVVKLDHHCPWINNCLGKNNHKFFLQFLIFVCVGCVYAAGLHGANLWWCLSTRACPKPAPHRLVICIVAGVLAVFFAIFVIAMMCDQYEAVITDTTGIEALKKWHNDNRPVLAGLIDIMGEPPSLGWLLPTRMPDDTAFDHDGWTLATYDVWDERDPRVADHYAKCRGYDWIDDSTRFKYSVDTILAALNDRVPRSAKSRYVIGSNGYPELRVFPGEEHLFPELGADDASIQKPKAGPAKTTKQPRAEALAPAPEDDAADVELASCRRPDAPDAPAKPDEDDVAMLD